MKPTCSLCEQPIKEDAVPVWTSAPRLPLSHSKGYSDAHRFPLAKALKDALDEIAEVKFYHDVETVEMVGGASTSFERKVDTTQVDMMIHEVEDTVGAEVRLKPLDIEPDAYFHEECYDAIF